jgi:hypothetical protein
MNKTQIPTPDDPAKRGDNSAIVHINIHFESLHMNGMPKLPNRGL